MKKSISYIAIALFSTGIAVASTLPKTSFSASVEISSSATPLSIAISKGDTQVVKKFVEYGADVNEVSNGLTPLMIAARYNRVEIIEILLANGANVNAKNERGLTALKMAELSNSVDAVRVLSQASKK